MDAGVEEDAVANVVDRGHDILFTAARTAGRELPDVLHKMLESAGRRTKGSSHTYIIALAMGHEVDRMTG